MKKIVIISALLAAGMLTGCMGGGSKGGKGKKTSTESSVYVDPETAARAIEAAKQYPIAQVSGTTTLFPDQSQNIGHNANDAYTNDYLMLTTVQTVLDRQSGQNVDVNVEWSYDTSDSFVKEKLDIDNKHQGLFFLYKAEQEHDFSFNAKLTCGEAEAQNLTFKVHLMDKNLVFPSMSIADIYKINEGNNGFDLVDYTGDYGYYKANNDNFGFCCVEVKGKLIYSSPDGNWALIADGDRTIQLYSSGAGRPLTKTQYPALNIGDTVTVEAELSSYKGNAQVSYIFDISKADVTIEADTDFKALHGDDFEGRHYWEGNLMNSLYSINGTYVGGSLKDNSGNIVSDVSQLANARFTFEVVVDGKTLGIAYDYHVDRNGNEGVFDAYKNKLTNLKDGDAVKISGVLRFAGKADKGYKQNQNYTTWNLVPYLAEHFA